MDWRAFIAKQALEPARAADAGTVPDRVCPLSGFGLLQLSGADAKTFLHNQASNNIETLGENDARPGALCNPKGRMYCNFLALRRGGDYFLRMPRERVAPAAQRLGMFVLMSKVMLHDAGEDRPGIGFIGKDACAWAGEQTAKLPGESLAMATVQPPGTPPRLEIYADGGTLAALWESAVQHGCAPSAFDVWRYCDIRAVMPQIYDATSEKLVPQMANLDLLGGVSFSKGCYPGQEIVARTHYLGKLKRRTYPFSTRARNVAVGDPVFSTSEQEPCGTVMDFCAIPDAPSGGLATLKISSLGGELHVRKPGGDALAIVSSPYEIREDSYNPES